MRVTKTLAACGFFLTVLLVGSAYAQTRPFWAQSIDIRSLDITESRKNYSLWSLLAESVAKSANSRSKAQVEAYFINPVTYIQLRGSTSDALKSPEEMKKELEEVYGRYSVFYVLLKTPDDERLVAADGWKVALRTTRKKEYSPEKLEVTEPELVFGYTGTYYQTKLLLFFDTREGAAGPAVDILQGDYLLVTNRSHKISEEIRWVSGPAASSAANPVAKVAFKAFTAALFGVLVVLCVLTRPRKEWSRKKA